MKQKIEEYRKLIKENCDDETLFTDYEYCKKCTETQTTCCENCPCELSPTDLVEVNKENILKLLETGLVVLDCYEGDLDMFGYNEYPKVWYLRMRGEHEGTGVVFGWGDKCICLNNGCMIDFKHRSYYGRRTPSCNKRKESPKYSSKVMSCKEWRQYYDLLEEISREIGSDSSDIVNDLIETILEMFL